MNSMILQKFDEGMEIRGFSEQTRATYLRWVKKLAGHYQRSPEEITDEELSQYLVYALREKKYARKTMILVVSALRAFYRIVCRRSSESLREVLPLMKNHCPLPRFYSIEEITRLLSVDDLQPKQRTMLITKYATGLRATELCRIKVTDIIASRMQIRVESGKGGKERYTVLSPKLLNILRNYWRLYRPSTWLFPCPYDESKPIRQDSLYRAFILAVKAAGLPDRGGIHSLRHSFATHMYEAGVGLPTLQSLLGHQQLSSTMIYLHASQSRLDEVRSPLDAIDLEPAVIKASGKNAIFDDRRMEVRK